MKLRSFLAFDITDEMRIELAQIIALIAPKAKDVRWVKPELMHCTLKFFGDVEEGLLLGRLSDVIANEVRHQAPVRLVGQGVGVFPNWRYPRVIWGGLAGETEAMMSLQAKLEEAFKEFGFKRDQRRFRLHLTIGRTRSPIKNPQGLMQIVEKLSDRNFGDITVSSLTLYKSVLTKEGSVYTALKKIEMGKNKPQKEIL